MSIHDFAQEGDLNSLMQEIKDGIDVNARHAEHFDFTPLMFAVESDDAPLNMVQFLLEHGADVNAASNDCSNSTVLCLAVSSGNLQKIRLVLDAGAKADTVSPNGYDAMITAMCALSSSSELHTVISLLIQSGAKLNVESDYSESAIKIASREGRFDIVNLLLESGADITSLEWTPLMKAIALGSDADVKKQLENHPDLAARDCWSRTPWLLSLQTGDVKKSKMLLDVGIDRSDVGRCGRTPLMYTVENRLVDMARWLVEQGFNPDDADEFQRTALMEAAELGESEMLRTLIELGARIDLRDHSDQQAIKLASNIQSLRILLCEGADLNDCNDEVRAKLTKLPFDNRLLVSDQEYLSGRNRVFGNSNPEKMNVPFWNAMIRSGATAAAARQKYSDENDEPVWCFKRFGKSINELPDGRIIEIAGEHEDWYDRDFCIYNDVIVHHGDGTFDIFCYPKDVFPTTDFHSATLVGTSIYIIGNLGYEVNYGETPIFRLDTNSYGIETLKSGGDSPGWISEHKAEYDLRTNSIKIAGGKLWSLADGEDSYEDNTKEFSLDLTSLTWNRIG